MNEHGEEERGAAVMPELDQTLDRDLTIRARRETVFRYFTDSERFAKWWGATNPRYRST